MSNTNRTGRQRETSRANGSQSSGPITVEGKARSSRNNLRHGLRSSRTVLSNESQSKYDKLLASYRNILNPVGQMEYDLVVNIIDAQWRLRRIKAMETAIIDAEMFIQMESLNAAFQPVAPEHRQAEGIMALAAGNSPGLEYYERAEARLSRSFDRYLKNFIRLQTLRTGTAPTFNFENMTDEPDTDQCNCEENENFSRIVHFARSPERPATQSPGWTEPRDSGPSPDQKPEAA